MGVDDRLRLECDKCHVQAIYDWDRFTGYTAEATAGADGWSWVAMFLFIGRLAHRGQDPYETFTLCGSCSASMADDLNPIAGEGQSG